MVTSKIKHRCPKIGNFTWEANSVRLDEKGHEDRAVRHHEAKPLAFDDSGLFRFSMAGAPVVFPGRCQKT